ncbi:hypothetical protein [Endozoicomonas elysicola]|uniref:Uncharacterized protein n=1 Tax=Endozoicomonas elysicola TaxID=305900 RepID=A0A081KAQ6_9GAMM|nr:hypothetical protein [Endozoicomonas elysicola]KEI71232.1 hypothetical protein GV64_11200 [Endozoicomonas elysicola]
MAEIEYVNDVNLNGRDIVNITGASVGYQKLSEIAVKAEANASDIATLQNDVSANQNYSEGVSGTTGTITAVTHGLGAIQALIVQIYDDANNLVHGAQINNTAGDITWTTTATMAANSYIVIGR